MKKAQIEKIKKEIEKLTVNLEMATARRNRTLEIMKEDASWEMFLEEDTKRVEYYTKHINRLNAMIKGAA